MDKQSVISKLLYSGFVWEKGRNIKSIQWNIVKRRQFRQHILKLKELALSISNDDINYSDIEAIHQYIDMIIKQRLPLKEVVDMDVYIQWKKSGSKLEACSMRDADSEKVSNTMICLLDRALSLLKCPIMKTAEIQLLMKALHNLPRAYYQSEDDCTFWHTVVPVISGKEALEYADDYLKLIESDS